MQQSRRQHKSAHLCVVLLRHVKLPGGVLALAVPRQVAEVHAHRGLGGVARRQERRPAVPVELQEVGGLRDVEAHVVPQLKVLRRREDMMTRLTGGGL